MRSELDDWRQAAGVEAGLRREFLARAIRAEEALEHVTELLVDTWATAMEGDPEKQAAVYDARVILAVVGTGKES